VWPVRPIIQESTSVTRVWVDGKEVR
jgi:hypothetical protein